MQNYVPEDTNDIDVASKYQIEYQKDVSENYQVLLKAMKFGAAEFCIN